MKLQEFEDLIPTFKGKLEEALSKKFGTSQVSIGKVPHQGNVWMVQCVADLSLDRYLIWLDKIADEPCWYRIPNGPF